MSIETASQTIFSLSPQPGRAGMRGEPVPWAFDSHRLDDFLSSVRSGMCIDPDSPNPLFASQAP